MRSAAGSVGIIGIHAGEDVNLANRQASRGRLQGFDRLAQGEDFLQSKFLASAQRRPCPTKKRRDGVQPRTPLPTYDDSFKT